MSSIETVWNASNVIKVKCVSGGMDGSTATIAMGVKLIPSRQVVLKSPGFFYLKIALTTIIPRKMSNIFVAYPFHHQRYSGGRLGGIR